MQARSKPRLSQDRWLRRQFFREWTNGLGTQFGLCCLVSGGAIFCAEVWSLHRLDHSIRLFAELSVLAAVTFILGDGYACQRRGCFPLLRRVARRCGERMRALSVSSPVIERFVHDVSFSPRMEYRYRSGMARSLRVIIEAMIGFVARRNVTVVSGNTCLRPTKSLSCGPCACWPPFQPRSGTRSRSFPWWHGWHPCRNMILKAGRFQRKPRPARCVHWVKTRSANRCA
jgi:hypothetical protein